MSEKYIHDRFLPDKAIDILDEACSRKNLDNVDFIYQHLKNLRRKISEAGGTDYVQTVYGLGYKWAV